MPRKRRRTRPTTAAATTTPEWQWRTIPVLFAFACGAFVMGLLNGATNPVGAIFFYLALFGVAAGSAHIVTRWFVERRLRRRQAVAPPAPEARQVAQEDARPPEGSRRSSRHGAARRR